MWQKWITLVRGVTACSILDVNSEMLVVGTGNEILVTLILSRRTR